MQNKINKFNKKIIQNFVILQKILKYILKKNGRILIITTNKTDFYFVKNLNYQIKSLNHINNWIGGLFTNHEVIVEYFEYLNQEFCFRTLPDLVIFLNDECISSKLLNEFNKYKFYKIPIIGFKINNNVLFDYSFEIDLHLQKYKYVYLYYIFCLLVFLNNNLKIFNKINHKKLVKKYQIYTNQILTKKTNKKSLGIYYLIFLLSKFK